MVVDQPGDGKVRNIRWLRQSAHELLHKLLQNSSRPRAVLLWQGFDTRSPPESLVQEQSGGLVSRDHKPSKVNALGMLVGRLRAVLTSRFPEQTFSLEYPQPANIILDIL